MEGNPYRSWNGQYDDPPPYSLVADQGPVFYSLSFDEDPPPSYSSLDLSNPTSDPSPQLHPTTQSSLGQKSPKYTEVTRIPRGCDVPTYICWSIFNVVFFPPVGLIALIISLKVCYANKKNNGELAWRNHVNARRINIAATFLGIMAALYYAIAVPLMFARRRGNI